MCKSAVLFIRLLQEVRTNGTGLEFWGRLSSIVADTSLKAPLKYPARLFKNVMQVFRPA
jgi:hypothetical protein